MRYPEAVAWGSAQNRRGEPLRLVYTTEPALFAWQRKIRCKAGTRIVRQGEPGSSLYMVASGVFEVRPSDE
jgi:hypothetical protein